MFVEDWKRAPLRPGTKLRLVAGKQNHSEGHFQPPHDFVVDQIIGDDREWGTEASYVLKDTSSTKEVWIVRSAINAKFEKIS